SAESGIPTYRDSQTGMWANYDPVLFATSMGYLSQPALAWQWYEHRRAEMREAQPNPAHHQLAYLQKIKPNVSIITQNIDDLHERAGSQSITHLHGDIYRNYCIAHCQSEPTIIDPVPESDDLPPK